MEDRLSPAQYCVSERASKANNGFHSSSLSKFQNHIKTQHDSDLNCSKIEKSLSPPIHYLMNNKCLQCTQSSLSFAETGQINKPTLAHWDLTKFKHVLLGNRQPVNSVQCLSRVVLIHLQLCLRARQWRNKRVNINFDGVVVGNQCWQARASRDRSGEERAKGGGGGGVLEDATCILRWSGDTCRRRLYGETQHIPLQSKWRSPAFTRNDATHDKQARPLKERVEIQQAVCFDRQQAVVFWHVETSEGQLVARKKWKDRFTKVTVLTERKSSTVIQQTRIFHCEESNKELPSS